MQSQSIVAINGQFVSPEQARVSVFDRGFLFGDGVFEVMRVYDGTIFAFQRHFERLRDSCHKVGIPFEHHRSELKHEIQQSIAKLGSPNAYVRIMITRGAGALRLLPPDLLEPQRVVIALPVSLPAKHYYTHGIAAWTVKGMYKVSAPGAKSSDYLAHYLATQVAQQHQAQEALLLGPYGELREGATSNVYVIQGKTILTPPASLGILQGITRAALATVIQEQADFAWEERMLWPSDLYNADEVWISSSIRQLMPVAMVDSQTVAQGQVGPHYKKLAHAFEQWLQSRLRQHHGDF